VLTLQSTLGETHRSGFAVQGKCLSGHSYVLDLPTLTALMTPFARLDEVLLTRSWCPTCGELAEEFVFLPPTSPQS
jgi:hypothetical protein